MAMAISTWRIILVNLLNVDIKLVLTSIISIILMQEIEIEG
jgi:hypothetical protein